MKQYLEKPSKNMFFLHHQVQVKIPSDRICSEAIHPTLREDMLFFQPPNIRKSKVHEIPRNVEKVYGFQ